MGFLGHILEGEQASAVQSRGSETSCPGPQACTFPGCLHHVRQKHLKGPSSLLPEAAAATDSAYETQSVLRKSRMDVSPVAVALMAGIGQQTVDNGLSRSST